MINTASTINDTGGDIPTSFTRPRILLTGLRRSGKTSIQRVIFTKMQPSQTQFLESTPQLTMSHFSCGSFINFQVQELPGQLHIFPSSHNLSGAGGNSGQASSYDDGRSTYTVGGGFDIESLLKQCNAVVYIIDAQDDYNDSILRLNTIIQMGRRVNSKIRYEVFIHKSDQLSDEAKAETQRDIHNQVHDSLGDNNVGIDLWPLTSNMSHSNSQEILINFHLTSIFDHSIFEAFSKVIQKLIPQFGHLEHLLNYLLSASNIEQAFLFDVQTKISIATDSSPTDMQMYELCCDMIDLLISMSEIYGQPNGNGGIQTLNDDETGQVFLKDEDENFSDDTSVEPLVNGYNHQSNPNSPSGSPPLTNQHSHPTLIETTSGPASNVFDSMSSSVIKLTGGRALYLKEINRHLALICVLREEALSKQAIIDYNVKQLKESILKLFRLNQQTSRPSVSSSNFAQ